MTFGAKHLGVSLAALLTVSTFGAAPELEGAHPTGGAIGSTNLVSLAGKFEPWPPKIWVSDSNLVFHASTNKGKISIEIPANAPPGPRFFRIYNDEGASEVRFFVVGDGHEIPETEPNDEFKKPAVITNSTVVINGRLDKRDDVDSYAIDLRAGESLTASVESYTLMAKVDAVLRLVDTNGYQLCWNHDHATFDPKLTWKSKRDQRVVLQIFGFQYPAGSEVRFFGSDAAYYRLHIARSETETEIEWPIASEKKLTPGKSVKGRIADGDQIDRYEFVGVKDKPVRFDLNASSLGSPLDAWLRIEDSDGKELARNDDAEGSLDPTLNWTPKSDGAFRVTVGSVTHRGSPNHIYELSASELKPTFTGTLASGVLVASGGTTNELKFKLERLHGHTNELRAEFRGLTPAISVEGLTNLPAKTGDVTLKLIAATDASQFNGPVELVLTDTVSTETRLVPFSLLTRGENNGVPNGYHTLAIPEVPHLWLTVRPKPAPTEEPKK